MKEIPKVYDSSKEEEIYGMWEKSGYFSPEGVDKYFEENKIKKVGHFGIPLPPPNANGDLHLGHTCGYAFQDLMGRFNRMNGRTVLLLPGKDHAGIQTEAVFTKLLEKQGESKWEMGREKFYERCYEFCTQMMVNARKQEKRIGLSADWNREFFTLDPRLTTVIYSTFFKLMEDGLVYRGKRIVNICPKCKTALADVDTEHMEMRGIFAYIVYPFVEEEDRRKAKEKWGQEGIVVATTRPETMLGDTAVAVNPEDERYKEFVGHKVLLPFVEREIPIIADSAVSIEDGTGALKVTPAHSPVDYEIGRAHDLAVENVINADGRMEGNIPERFKGMETVECSKALVKELDEMGLLLKIENIKHEVAVCERCKTPIEPIISKQWFVNMKTLARKALDFLKAGEVRVIPVGQQKALEFFLENIQDWCISRQLWWGHRIPIWYSGGKELYDWLIDNPEKTVEDFNTEKGKSVKGDGKAYPSDEMPEGDFDWEAETDVFDTWFSSGQWPFSTLKANGNDFDLYYPASVMETARDILFWWVARMIMLGIYVTGKAPFNTVFLHGLILAEDGTKMSKSKGNTKEPTDIFEKYGADALRLWYYNESLPGSNAPLREEKIKGNRFFINKIWNASRFIFMNVENIKNKEVDENSERMIEFKKFKEDMIKHYSNFKFHLASETGREFFWHTLCDKWIEEVKKENTDQGWAEIFYILKESLKVLHPMIPYITEAIWQELVSMGLAEGLLLVQQL